MVRLKHRWTIGVLEQSGRSKTAFSRHDIRDAIQVRLGLWLKQHQPQTQNCAHTYCIGGGMLCGWLQEEVASLFGDFGIGAMVGSLQGVCVRRDEQRGDFQRFTDK